MSGFLDHDAVDSALLAMSARLSQARLQRQVAASAQVVQQRVQVHGHMLLPLGAGGAGLRFRNLNRRRRAALQKMMGGGNV